MSRWFRHYAGMMSDPKFGAVARRCSRCRAEVLFVWGCILESAAEANSSVYGWDADAVAEMMGVETPIAQAIHDELAASGLLAAGKIVQWDQRQFVSDSSTERSRKHRDALRNADATLQQQHATPPETETYTETEKKKEKSARASRSTPKLEHWPLEAIVPEDWIEEARAKRSKLNLPPIDLRLEAEKFANYWAQRRDKKAARDNWKLTWFSWILSDKYGGKTSSSRQSRPSSVGETLRSIAGDIADLEADRGH